MKVLLSAFACDPTKGSEPGNGWNWAIGLAQQGYEVHCLTRIVGRSGIESLNSVENLYFHYIKLPLGLESLYTFSQPGMYLYYLLWQWKAFTTARLLNRRKRFDIAHHVTWGSLQMGSFLYKLNIPFIFGPAGGGQKAPKSFKKYFANHWASESKRESVSNLFQKWNPAFKNMIRKANVVITSNTETFNLAKNSGARQVELMLDAALPEHFFPKIYPVKDYSKKDLNLLWIGRFLPRKGILLVLEVMNKLKSQTNITLTVVGDGEMKDSFLKAVDDFSLHKQVKWLGKVNYADVKSIYASHDVFLFTSLRDSCPAQLIEAMAYGLPVVTLDLHGQGLLVDNTRGIKCSVEEPSKTVDSLVRAILKLYEDKKLISALSESAYKFALEQSWKNKITTITNKFYK